jgi:surface protein
MIANIKSSYILRRIFNALDEKKRMKIINYNKKLQNRINLSFIDYKMYLKIEIELILIDESLRDNDNYFIFKHFENTHLLHIYFNNENIERYRIKVTKTEKISKIKIIIDKYLKSLKYLFLNCSCIKEIKFIRFNRKDITDMCCMFCECNSLKYLDISKINTDNVIDMRYMFSGCSQLETIDISNLKTNNTKLLCNMF